MEIIILFVLGTIFGSFGSVLMTRLGKNTNIENIKGIFRGRSQCPNCKHNLGANNLIPLVSFIAQKWKCQYCKKKISLIYPILEITSGLVFVLTYFFINYLQIHSATILIFWIITNRLLLLLLVYDIQNYELNLPIRTILTCFSIIFHAIIGNQNILTIIFSTFIFTLIFWLIYTFSKYYLKIKYQKKSEGLGIGDIYMAFGIGILLPLNIANNGFGNDIVIIMKLLLIFVILSCLIGIFYGVIEIIFKKKGNKENFIKSKIPFIPSMILAFRIILFFSTYLISFLS
ncbi:MAG: prepilin peptidase [Candidatus Absconditabacterales bacterium]